MPTKTPSRIGYKSSSGELSDRNMHTEIMGNVDDSALRLTSAKRGIQKLGLTKEQAESLFKVKIPDDF